MAKPYCPARQTSIHFLTHFLHAALVEGLAGAS